jgi:proteasome accessory factor C
MTPVSTRLMRLLNMVPYFQANPRTTYAKAAADLGVTRKQLEQDVKQLWMCGLPGYGPGDLIDFEFSGDTIEVTFSAGMDRPLRLTSPEATGLLVALRALADIPGVLDPAAARSAMAKIEAAAGTVIDDDVPAAVDEPAPAESDVAAAVRAAVRDRRALAIEYYSASRDALSRRTVDPIRVVLVGDQSYLEGWCREAEGVRLFRFDRIVDVEVLDEASAPPVAEAPPNTALFDADPSLPAATLRVGPRAAWMLEYFPMRVLRELPGGSCEVAMTFAAEEWMTRLILGLGADVQVLTPESLVVSVRRAATAALAAYGGLEG